MTTMADLESEVQRLAKRVSLLSIALNQGLPLELVNVVAAPVRASIDVVSALCTAAEEAGVTGITVQIDQAFSDSLSETLANAISGTTVPDDISSLIEEA